MKISFGKYKFKKINSIKNKSLKPTSNKVREAIFNILINKYEWLRWGQRAHLLDAFSGSGIITFEAFSRQLNQATIVEHDIDIFNNLKKNILHLKLSSKITLINSDFFNLKLDKNNFNIIYLDPPYYNDYTNLAIQKILDENVLKKDSIIISETIKNYNYNKEFDKYISLKKVYGKTCITFLEIN
tara:strand:+ start:666 stop:1220 length:555 start_codon:yes stop_codon:yes gene_type:complete